MPTIERVFHTFKAPWNDVSLASWQKYPCPDRPDVLSVDIVEKKLDESTGVLYATRVTILKDRLPSLMTRIFGPGFCLCIEDSMVDPKNKVMVLKSKNISFKNIVSIQEICTYTQNKENPNYTNLVQEANVQAFPFGISSTIERFLTDKFVTNAEKGRLVMENAINRVRENAELAYGKFLSESVALVSVNQQ